MVNNESWVERYRPETFSDIQGHNSDLRDIKQWAKNWSPGDKPILLVGPPGIGKTTIAYVLSNYMDYPLQEINASSARKTCDIARVSSSLQSTPSDADRQLVLFDEVDGYNEHANLKPLTNALSDAKNPVVMTANSKYDVPNGVKRPADLFELSLGKRSREAKLRDIAEQEELDVDPEDLSKLAERPDLRSGINDLQRWAEDDVPPGEDQRTFEKGAFEVMGDILRGEPDTGFGMTPDELVMWLDENTMKEYRGVEAAIAYDCLARADKYLGYAQDTRDYGYWKYANTMIEQVARVRLTEPYDGWLDLDFPEWYRSSTPSVGDETPTASVYRKLKDYEGGTFQFGGDYVYFRRVLLPMLLKLPVEQRKNLALENALDMDEAEVLGLDAANFDEWRSSEGVPEERQEEEARIGQESAMSW